MGRWVCNIRIAKKAGSCCSFPNSAGDTVQETETPEQVCVLFSAAFSHRLQSQCRVRIYIFDGEDPML